MHILSKICLCSFQAGVKVDTMQIPFFLHEKYMLFWEKVQVLDPTIEGKDLFIERFGFAEMLWKRLNKLRYDFVGQLINQFENNYRF